MKWYDTKSMHIGCHVRLTDAKGMETHALKLALQELQSVNLDITDSRVSEVWMLTQLRQAEPTLRRALVSVDTHLKTRGHGPIDEGAITYLVLNARRKVLGYAFIHEDAPRVWLGNPSKLRAVNELERFK